MAGLSYRTQGIGGLGASRGAIVIHGLRVRSSRSMPQVWAGKHRNSEN